MIYNEAIAAADKKVEEVEDSAWPDNSQITWNLFVDGNAGSYIDFGYSEDYVKFGEDDNQAFTIELWVNIKEYCNKQGEDNCTFLSTIYVLQDSPTRMISPCLVPSIIE